MKKNSLPGYYLGFGLSLFTIATAQAQNENNARSKDIDGKRYGVNLQIGPAEKIANDAAGLKQGGLVFKAGAKPVVAAKSGDYRHVGVFVYRDDQQVKDADVRIVCEPLDDAGAASIEVPVAHLYTSETGLQAPHFGNNVALESGAYRVNVMVDGNASANFFVEI